MNNKSRNAPSAGHANVQITATNFRVHRSQDQNGILPVGGHGRQQRFPDIVGDAILLRHRDRPSDPFNLGDGRLLGAELVYFTSYWLTISG